MKTTFWSILSNTSDAVSAPNGILIPKIQRDYAQGRKSTRANEIRSVFLKNIVNALVEYRNDSNVGLDLDFVYGTSELGSFVPLDGQQRLTTLFLIHWYLAFKGNKLTDYLPVFSKFHYETRPSSNEFLRSICNKISKIDFTDIFNKNRSIEQVIKNENWYYAAWNHDSTIQAMITMLASIHHEFSRTDIEINDLTDPERCAITFNFLQLDTFGLSDSLYIKMNARGKQLTNFENLKAQLAKLIKDSDFNNNYSYHLTTSSGIKPVDVETYFVTQVDTAWSDYFWVLRNEKNEFDDKLLNLLTLVALNELVVKDLNVYNDATKTLESTSFISYYSLNNAGLLFEDALVSYIDILDILCSKNKAIKDVFKETRFTKDYVSPIFEEGIGANYERRVVFQGVFNFLRKQGENVDEQELKRWINLLKNLATNTNYDRSEDLRASLIGINEFLEAYSGDIYSDYINQSIKGFDSVQTKEELIKLQLKLKSVDWIELIDSIEQHGFLKGQISCVLVFSGILQVADDSGLSMISKKENDKLFEKLKITSKIFGSIFNENGLRLFEKEEFRRALLTFEDFSIYSTNWFFYNNTNHRDLSWRRLLKETANLGQTYKVGALALIELFAHLSSENSITHQLNDVIKKYLDHVENKNWKYYFIKYPILFLSSKAHYVKFFVVDQDQFIYCLNKTKYNPSVDYDFMSLVLKSELDKLGFDTTSIDFEYSNKYQQFGISSIRGKSIKIVYNSPLDVHKFILKPYGSECFTEKSLKKVVNYIVENY